MSGNCFGSSMIWSAVWSLTPWATGIGWYGEPDQHGALTPFVHSRVLSLSAV